MRRVVHTLAAAAAVIAAGLTAMPAQASPAGAAGPAGAGARAGATIRAGASATTPARRRALARAERISAQLSARGSITGVVLRPGGAPAANVCVRAIGLTASRIAFSRPDGSFVLAGLRRGAYVVEYRGCSRIARYAGQWYGGMTRATASRVLVTGLAPARLAPVTLAPVSAPGGPRSRPVAGLTPAERLRILITRIESGQRVTVGSPAPASSTAGRITGRVTNRAGHALGRVCVFAITRSAYSFAAVTLTSARGGYNLRVRPGRYLVSFVPSCGQSGNYAPQLWHGAGSIAKATVLRVRARQLIRHVDAVLGAGAVITGRVRTAAASHPSLGGLCVDAMGTGGQRFFQSFTTTRSNGSFRLPDLATGKYRLTVFPGCGPSSPYLPTVLRRPIAVTDGRTTAGVSMTVRLGGAIAGTVTDSGGHPLGGICVSANGTSFGAAAASAPDGTYLVQGLPSDSYQMQFSTGCGNNGAYAPVTLPALVRVTAGKTVTGIDAIMPAYGAIAGTVTGSGGTPLPGICVVAESDQSGAVTTTRSDGSYRLTHLAPGNYQVQFIPGGAFSDCGNDGNYLPVTESATVSSALTTTLDAVLPVGGIVAGVVTDSRGRPLSGVCVFTQSATSFLGNQVVTGADGSYALQQLPTDQYFVGFAGGCGNTESVAPQAYRADPTFLAPSQVPVTAGKTKAGIDATMQPGGTLTGRVTDRSGRPLSGICVFITGATGAGGSGSFEDFQITKNGRYTSANLPPGQFTVDFTGMRGRNGGCGPSRYADQAFRGRNAGISPDLVSVAGGTVTGGAGASLAPAGQISGTVRGKRGHAVPGECVTAVDARTGAAGFAISGGGGGGYVVHDIPAGRYKVEFTSCGEFGPFGGQANYAGQWYKDSPTEASATAVAVTAGRTTRHIDSALTAGGSIAGQVSYGPSGRPVSYVCVYATTRGLAFASAGLTGRRGRYVIPGLGTGRYRLIFVPCAAESALAGQVGGNGVRVVAGQASRAGDERLRLGGSVSGVVSASVSASARPAPGACVEMIPLSPTELGFASVATAGGGYAISNLMPGQYLVYFGNPACSQDSPALAAQFTSGQVTVAPGQDTGGVDVILQRSGAISGAVRGPHGRPVTGICAEAIPVRGGIGPVVGVTGSAGRYLIVGLQPGGYKVRFTVGCGARGYATRWYKGARTRARATIVRVRAAANTSGIGATLPRG